MNLGVWIDLCQRLAFVSDLVSQELLHRGLDGKIPTCPGHLDHLCNILGPFEGHLGAHFVPSWDYRGTTLVHLGTSWDVLWLAWGPYGQSCATLESILGHLGTADIFGTSGLS